MLSMDSNDILTRVGPGTPMGELMREYWIPACLPTELAADGDADAAAAAGREADRLPRQLRAASASWIIAARIAAPRCSSAATRKTASAASTTAGSSTSPATASTCPTCRRTSDFKRARSRPRPTRPPSAAARLGLHGRARGAAAAAGARGLRPARRTSASSCATSATATGCSRSKATSTPRTSASCMSAP